MQDVNPGYGIIMMNDTPLVSVIMNCYNGEKYLREAIDSVYAQTYLNWEIIFWDNASIDASAEIAKSYDGKIKYFYANRNAPLGEARNLALSKAKGKYLAFLDTDDLYLPKKLEKQVNMMESTDYAMCYGSAIIINEQGDELKKRHIKTKSGYIFGDLLKHYNINMQSVMILRSILMKNKLNFDESLSFSPDYNLFMRIASIASVCVIEAFIVKYRKVGGSLSEKSIDIAGVESKYTLDILSKNHVLRDNYSKQFVHAYAKVNYYTAISFLNKNKRFDAISAVSKIIYVRLEYFFLLCVLLMPISSKIIFKFLRS